MHDLTLIHPISVAWVYPAEIFSMNMRSKGISMTSATNWFVVSISEIRLFMNNLLTFD